MRERLFRAWHEEGKVMVYFDPKKLVSDIYQAQHLMMLIKGDYGDVLMDYTGLKDKNGVKIFEGDKVAVYHKKSRNNPQWDNLIAFTIDDMTIENVYTTCGMEEDNFDRREIIGNIHEAK